MTTHSKFNRDPQDIPESRPLVCIFRNVRRGARGDTRSPPEVDEKVMRWSVERAPRIEPRDMLPTRDGFFIGILLVAAKRIALSVRVRCDPLSIKRPIFDFDKTDLARLFQITNTGKNRAHLSGKSAAFRGRNMPFRPKFRANRPDFFVGAPQKSLRTHSAREGDAPAGPPMWSQPPIVVPLGNNSPTSERRSAPSIGKCQPK